MKANYLAVLIELVIMAVVDVVMYIFIKDWTNTMICSIVMIDLAFVLNMVSFLTTPNHKNSYIFQSSTSIFASYLIIIEIALMLVGLFVKEIPEPYIMVIEIVVFIIFTILFIMNVVANNHTAQTADVNDAGVARISDVTSCLYEAFNAAEGNEMKSVIEKAYDKSRSLTGFRDELADYDQELMDVAEAISAQSKTGDVDAVQQLYTKFCNIADERAQKARKLQSS